MAIVKTEQKAQFKNLRRGEPFAANITLYTRTDFADSPKEHILYKLNNHKAVTVDKRTSVHFLGDEEVVVCEMEKKERKVA